MDWLWVGLGGSLGAVLRYWVGRWMQIHIQSMFPWPTMLINVTGTFVLGLVTRFTGLLLAAHIAIPLTLFLGTGVCGGYTTFSTFSYETVRLFQQNQWASGFFYIGGTLTLCFAVAGVALYGIPLVSQ